MPDPKPTVWPFDGTKIAVLADCHIHPGGGPAFPPQLFDILDAEDPDLIVTLGDMGEAAGLDELAEFAPVIGVRGQDDSDDPRTDNHLLVLDGGLNVIGCVFDPKAAGLVSSADPFAPLDDFDAVSARLFGRRINLLLYASTHKAALPTPDHGGVLAINPGSAVLPGEGARPTFALLTAGDHSAGWQIVELD
jgi:predicted phosphodiesterase